MALPLGIKELKYISDVLTQKLGFDYGNFSFSFLKRRFNFLFDELNIKKIEQFVDSLSDLQFVERFHYLFAVPSTELFRDPSFWRSLRNKVLPANDCANLIWFPDASSGEEIFSLLIILADANMLNQFDVHCNHLSKYKLEEIQQGLLRIKNFEVNESNFKRLGIKGHFTDYFDVCDEGLILKSYLLDRLHCHNCHFTDQLFGIKPSIVIFRNSMLYFTKKYSAEAAGAIYNVMCPKGFFAIGIKENLPDSVLANMLSFDTSEQIFKRHPASVALL